MTSSDVQDSTKATIPRGRRQWRRLTAYEELQLPFFEEKVQLFGYNGKTAISIIFVLLHLLLIGLFIFKIATEVGT